MTKAEIQARNTPLQLDFILLATQPFPGIASMQRIQSSQAREISTFIITAVAGRQAQQEAEESQENPSLEQWYAVECDRKKMYPQEVIAVHQENG